MSYQPKSEIADPILYRLYFSIITRDILYKLGFDSNKRNKQILHEFHKRVLNYETIAGQSQEIVSTFIAEVLLFWAEQGIFVRSNSRQEIGMEDKALSEIWSKL